MPLPGRLGGNAFQYGSQFGQTAAVAGAGMGGGVLGGIKGPLLIISPVVGMTNVASRLPTTGEFSKNDLADARADRDLTWAVRNFEKLKTLLSSRSGDFVIPATAEFLMHDSVVLLCAAITVVFWTLSGFLCRVSAGPKAVNAASVASYRKSVRWTQALIAVAFLLSWGLCRFLIPLDDMKIFQDLLLNGNLRRHLDFTVPHGTKEDTFWRVRVKTGPATWRYVRFNANGNDWQGAPYKGDMPPGSFDAWETRREAERHYFTIAKWA